MKRNHTGYASAYLFQILPLFFFSIVVNANCGCSKKNAIPSTNYAAISRELLEIEKSYKAHIQTASANTYQAPVKFVRIVNGHIAVDAVAVDKVKFLLSELEKLGLQKGASYGRKVSGLLPIEAIDKLKNLRHLKSIRPAYMKTNIGRQPR